MAFETQTININSKNKVGESEFAVSTKISLDAEKPLVKVLSVKALADIVSFENVDAEFTALGKTQVNVLYLTENNALDCVSGFAEWQTSTKAFAENLQAQINVVEYSIDAVSSSEISISMLHNMQVEGIIKQQIFPVCNLPENYVTSTKNIDLNTVNMCASGNFVVAENLEILTAEKVLCVDVFPKIKHSYCAIDQVTIEGELDAKILYLTANGTATLTKILEFKQEIACQGALPEHSAHTYLNIGSINATLSIADKTTLALAVKVNAQVETYSNKEFSVIDDLYSLKNNLKTTTDCISFTNYVASKHFTDTAVCSAQVDSINLDEIVAMVSPVVQVSKYEIENNNILLDGVVTAELLYKNNEIDQINSSIVKFPFICKLDGDFSGQINNINVDASISSVKIRSDREIEVLVDFAIDAAINSESYFEYIKDIQELDLKEQPNSAITIFVTKENENLFDVAKALNVLPQTITNQNEVVDGKFASGQRIFVYSPLNVEF